jgi:hypothetical protein
MKPSLRPKTTASQTAFRALSRGRRAKLAKVAHTSLVKADQWARGDAVAKEVAAALEAELKKHSPKEKSPSPSVSTDKAPAGASTM